MKQRNLKPKKSGKSGEQASVHDKTTKNRGKLRNMKRKRVQSSETIGDHPAKVQRTIESMRAPDITTVATDDAEVLQDISCDEFADYFSGKPPRVLITTNVRPTKYCYRFAEALARVLTSCTLIRRKTHTLKEITEYAEKSKFTDIIVLNENAKTVTDLMIAHLPKGPIAHFKVMKIFFREQMKGCSKSTLHVSELILNNFTTRLGVTVGRMIAALFPQRPVFGARQVATFHCQRDFIFFRHHRYTFADSETKRERSQGPIVPHVQELGPRFVLKLLSLQIGSLKEHNREYIFVRKKSKHINSESKHRFDL